MTTSQRGFGEILEGVTAWRLWTRLGTQEVRRRYRRTLLGPFWAAASLGIFIFAMGFTWARLWNQEVQTYLPFVCSGMLVWTLTLNIVTEGCGAFVGNSGLITQFRMPYSLLVCVVIWRNILLFFHNLVIFVLVGLYVKLKLSWMMLLVFPALALHFVNGIWVVMLLGLLCARFRDVQQLIGSVMQIGLFVTPIFWDAAQLGGRGDAFVTFNPLFHFMDIVRSPLLGKSPSTLSWMVCIGVVIAGWAVMMRQYYKYNRRLPYWL